MKVWIVMEQWDHDGARPVGVFDTKIAAEACRDRKYDMRPDFQTYIHFEIYEMDMNAERDD